MSLSLLLNSAGDRDCDPIGNGLGIGGAVFAKDLKERGAGKAENGRLASSIGENNSAVAGESRGEISSNRGDRLGASCVFPRTEAGLLSSEDG